MLDLKTRVLIVDDSSTIRLSLRALLKDFGFHDVCEATNGNEAWEILNQKDAAIGLILSDHHMPECTGVEFLKRLRADERFRKLPFLLLTSDTGEDLIVSAIKSGVSNYVPKPIEPAILRKKLEAVSGKR